MKKEKNKNIPSHYKTNLARVSEIVEFVYPFKGTVGEKRFYNWLYEKNITPEEYMKEASEGGTYVHSKLEEYLLTKNLQGIDNKYLGLIINGVDCINDKGITHIHIEKYISHNHFQGTIDLIADIDGEEWIIDWKSWGLAKYRFGLHNGKYRKPTDKLKKARLQLSLYSLATGIKNIAVIELDKSGYYFHKLKPHSKKELEEIILEFNKSLCK